MIILETTKTTVEVINRGESLQNFFSKIAFCNPSISEWMTLQGESVTISIDNLDRLVSLAYETGLTVEFRTV